MNNFLNAKFRSSCVSDNDNGEAIYIHQESKSASQKDNEIHHTTFKNCKGKNGGAIYIKTTKLSRLYDITNCTFENNQSIGSKSNEGEGGAIYFEGTYSNIIGCKFINNAGIRDGSITYNDNAQSDPSDRIFTIKENHFERNDSSSSGCSLIYLYIEAYSRFSFSNNEIITTDETKNAALFDCTFTASPTVSYTFSSNCYSPSNSIIYESESLKDIIPSKGFTPCSNEPIKPVDPTTPINHSDSSTINDEVNTLNPTSTLTVDDLTVDDSNEFTGNSIEFTKNGYIVDSKEHSILNKNSDTILVHSQENVNIIRINTTSEKPEKAAFVSPKNQDSTTIIMKPSAESNDFGLGEVGVHANSNLKNIVLQTENVPLNIYNNEESKVSISLDNPLDSPSLSLKDLIVNDGTIQMQVQEGIESIGFNSIDAYKTDKIDAKQNNKQVDINVNNKKLNRGSQLTITTFNVSDVIKSNSQSKLIFKTKATFNENARIELTESSLIDFRSSLIEGIVKEIKLLDPEPTDKRLQETEKLISLICGKNFNCSEWKDKFVGNNEFLSAKCMKNYFENQICLAASNSHDALDKNTNKNKPLSGGAIAGIVIAVVVVVAAIIIAILFVLKKKADDNPAKFKQDISCCCCYNYCYSFCIKNIRNS